ncbi:MAG: hypothetical protein WED04_09580 [Promethearchaeati archaeon SRVP18_Atabeyarchaeia-1]
MNDSGILSANQTRVLGKLVYKGKNRPKSNRKLAIGLIKKKKKNQQDFYKSLSFRQNEANLPQHEIEELVAKNLLKFISRKDKLLTVTLKAMLVLDYGITDLSGNMDEMLNDFNEVFFEGVIKLSDEPLEAREKAIILGLLGLGTVSEQYSLKPDKENQEELGKCIDDFAVSFIKELGPEYDDGTIKDLWPGDVVGEEPVLARMRRTDTVQARTEGVYRKKEGRHYLDILADEKIDEAKLTYLFERFFDKRPLSFEEKKKLVKALDGIQEHAIRLIRSNPPFDMLEIRRQIRRIIESKL